MNIKDLKSSEYKIIPADSGGMLNINDPGISSDIGHTKRTGAEIANLPGMQGNTELSDPLGEQGNIGVDFGLGAIKGATEVPNTIATFGERAFNWARGQGWKGGDVIPQSARQSEGIAQGVGKFTEQAVEFLAPTGAISKGSKAIEAGSKALKFGGKLGKFTQFGQKAASFAGRSALEGASAAGVTTLQGGSGQDIKTAAIAGSFIPAVSKAVRILTNNVSKQIVNSVFDRTFGERLKDIKLGDKGFSSFADRYLKEGKWFSSARTARDTITKKILPKLGLGLQRIADSPKGKKAVATIDLMPTLTDGLKQLKGVLGADNPLIKMVQKSQAQTMTWKQAWELKKAIYKYIPKNAWGADIKLSTIAGRLRETASTLNERLTVGAKGTDYEKLNNTYGLFSDVLESLQEKSARKYVSGLDKSISGLAAGAGILHEPQMAAIAASAAIVKKSLETVPVGLGSAFGLKKLGKNIPKTRALIPVIRNTRPNQDESN